MTLVKQSLLAAAVCVATPLAAQNVVYSPTFRGKPVNSIEILTLSMLPAETRLAMTDGPRALSLKVHSNAGTVKVELLGHPSDARSVSYRLEVTGTSTSLHNGKTKIAAGTPVVLSNVRARVGEDWCVRLWAEEDGSKPYEILEGSSDGSSN